MKNLNVKWQTQTMVIEHAMTCIIAATVVSPLKGEKKGAAVYAPTVFLVMLANTV